MDFQGPVSLNILATTEHNTTRPHHHPIEKLSSLDNLIISSPLLLSLISSKIVITKSRPRMHITKSKTLRVRIPCFVQIERGWTVDIHIRMSPPHKPKQGIWIPNSPSSSLFYLSLFSFSLLFPFSFFLPLLSAFSFLLLLSLPILS